MTRRDIWRHLTSGERYVVDVDESGRVLKAAGPLAYSDIPQALQDFDSDAELVDDLNESTDQYRSVDYV